MRVEELFWSLELRTISSIIPRSLAQMIESRVTFANEWTG